MKTLLVVRHAKSSWANFGEADFDRTLNDRGKKDGPEMAKRLLDKKIRIDAFVSSPAKRAKKTCKAFCEVYDFDKNNILLVDKLYHAQLPVFYEVVENLYEEHHNVALFSHNPGITEFVNTLVDEVHINNMPTCGVFAVQADVKSWTEFKGADKKFLFFDYPKNEGE